MNWLEFVMLRNDSNIARQSMG